MLRHLVVIFCLLCGCFGSEKSEDEHTKIVGGTELDIKGAPFTVLILYNQSPLCGGSIISSNYILTASHCTETAKAKDLTIQTGSSEVGGGKMFRVSHITMHPKYNNSNFNFDFCLLRIYGKIFYNKYQQAIALPNQGDETPEGEAVRVMGWGRTQNEAESTDYLRVVQLITINPKECEDSYKEYQIAVAHNKICAIHPERVDGKDACQGDSGGPLQRIKDGKLIGIVSFGLGCAKIDYPGIYAKVSSVRTWIKSIARV